MQAFPFTDLLTNARRYGPETSTHDLLKALAIGIMIADHIGYFFFPQELWWRAVGRIGFPVWFFMAGYAKPSRPPAIILFLCALMVLTDYLLGMAILPVNALLGIWLCRVFVSTRLLSLPLTVINWFLAILVVIATLPVSYPLFEYGFQAMLYALAGFNCRKAPRHPLTLTTLILACLVFLAMQAITFPNFSAWQMAFMVNGTILMTAILGRFRLSRLPSLAGWSAPVNFVARNSHYIYAVHFIAFETILHFLIDPARQV